VTRALDSFHVRDRLAVRPPFPCPSTEAGAGGDGQLRDAAEVRGQHPLPRPQPGHGRHPGLSAQDTGHTQGRRRQVGEPPYHMVRVAHACVSCRRALDTWNSCGGYVISWMANNCEVLLEKPEGVAPYLDMLEGASLLL
jgi:hypothetical protein